MNEQLTSLGQSVTSAFQFLTKIYSQIGLVIAELDTVLESTGDWQAYQKGGVTSDVSIYFNPEYWIAECFYRFYVPAASPNDFQTALVFILRLNPSGDSRQPMLMGAAAQYPNSTTIKSIYDLWKASDHTLVGLVKTPGPRPLTNEEIADFLPGATVIGLALPLCGITSSEALRTQVVNPLLRAIGQPEARPD